MAQVLEFEQQYLDALPSAQMYERSYMHRDTVNNIAVREMFVRYTCMMMMPAWGAAVIGQVPREYDSVASPPTPSFLLFDARGLSR